MQAFNSFQKSQKETPETHSEMGAFSPPDLCKINDLIKRSESGNGDSTELTKLIEDEIQYWQQQQTANSLTDAQKEAFDRFNQMHQYIVLHQLPGIDKALYGE